MLIPILPKTRFEYSYLTNAASQTVVIAPAVDLTPFRTLSLFVRFHAGSGQSTQSWAFNLYATLPSEEDPAEFTNSGSLLSVSVAGNASAGALNGNSIATTSVPPPFGKVVLTATQGDSSGATFYGELSAALFGRTS